MSGCKEEQQEQKEQHQDAVIGVRTEESQASPATLRLCRIPPPSSPGSGSCGFHISRTQWDPYPWVSAVELGSPAEHAGLRAGDCVLEVNGEDVLGQRIGDVAAKVRAGRAQDKLQLLVWNAGCDPGTAVTLTAGSGPTPLNLQLLSSCLQQAGQLLECPVCLESVSPPVWQCCHGHLLCSGCRARSERCPLCRVPLGPRGRSLLADKLHDLLSQTYRRYNDQRAGHASTAVDSNLAANTSTTGLTAMMSARVSPKTVPGRVVRTSAVSAATSEGNSEHREHVLMRGLRLTASSEDVSDVTEAVARFAVPPPSGGRARSHSAGHIGIVGSGDKDCPDWVHCPYGSVCHTTCASSDLLNHVRDDHDGPLTQYFPREGRQLFLPQLADLTLLTTKAGDTMFLHSERGCMWLWSLQASSPTSSSLCVDFPDDDDADHRSAPVFPLTASWEDVIASGRCARVPEQNMRISVRVVTPPTPTQSNNCNDLAVS